MKPPNPHNDQEVFDFVIERLRNQKYASMSEDGQCAYRGINGMRCAVGWLIPDKEYDISLEGRSCDSYKVKFILGSKYNGDLLIQLQLLHDHNMPKLGLDKYKEWVNDFERSVKEIARDFNLTYTPPEAN